MESYLDQVALTGLKLAERDYERGAIDGDQEVKIANTVKEMMDNLADFEPRRWFSKLHPAPEKNGKDKEEASGMATLAAAENGEDEHGKLPVVERNELAPGWVVDEPILSIGGRNALDAAAADMLAGVLRKRGLGVKEYGPEASRRRISPRSPRPRRSSSACLILASATARRRSAIWCGACGASCPKER